MRAKSHDLSAAQCFTLPCGLRVVYRHIDSPVMHCGFMVDCGTRHECDPAQYGMAHFVEHILFKGTTHRDAWHINNRMESVGGELNAFTTKEETTFYAIGQTQDTARAIDLLCDLLFHATAPQHELEKEQEVVIDEIMSYQDSPAELVFDVFEDQLFAHHPLGHNILGNESTVRAFDHEATLAFIRRYYQADRMVFFYQGKTPFSRIITLLERGQLPAPSHPSAPSPCPDFSLQDPAATATQQTIADRHQSHVLYGTTAYPIDHPRTAALALASHLLGGPGMNSRLGLSLRERRGLVYTVESSVVAYTDTGYFGIYFGCDHDDLSRCLHLCTHELQRLLTDGLNPYALTRVKKQLCGTLALASTNLENSAIAMAKSILRKGRVDSLQDLYQQIEAVTPELFLATAQEVLDPARFLTVVLQ